MSSLDTDHNHYALNHHHHHHHQGTQSPPYAFATQVTDPAEISDPSPASIPPLPAYVYTPSAKKRPLVSTARDYNAVGSSAQTNGPDRTPGDDNSPDPHDFYRRHQDPFGTGMMDGLGQGDIRVETREGSRAPANHQHAPTHLSNRTNGPKPTSLASRLNNSHYTSSATKSSPALPNTARNRQTSLKDLVNRFNQTPDEVPPVPRKSTSRSPSTSSNPATQSPRSRTAPQSSKTETGAARKGRSSNETSTSKGSRFQQRRGRTQEDLATSPRSKRYLSNQDTDRWDARPFASQSMTNLSPDAEALPSKPLFGEVLTVNRDHPDLGYGIPVARRRRGSEGSMHSPNPMFPAERLRHRPEISPSSPTAWYLGAAPTLDEIKAEKNIPERPTNVHRRTRSDFEGVPSFPPTSRMYGTNFSPPSSPASTNTSKRNSQSRIPISTRRLSTTSDSGNSTPSTRNNSALGRVGVKSPSRARAPPPRPLQNPRTPPRHSRSSTPQKSPRRDDHFMGARLVTSPRLNAYISAPLPKKSPPLRSSRPRQPVSNATTSASRAKAVERFSGQNGTTPKNTRESRPRKPPELGGVDFAARRQKIQQAFTKTVKENERQEVEAQRRASMALEGPSLEGSFTADESEPLTPQLDTSGNTNHDREDHAEISEDAFENPVEELLKSERELTINTAHLSERSVLDLSMEDSPTLGTFSRFSSNLNRIKEGHGTPLSDVEPSSAITARTSDSVDTFFDDEPQNDSPSGSRHQSGDQETLLSHIMNMRGSRSPSPTADRPRTATEETNSDRDDRESIHIMLSETPVLDKAPFTEQYEDRFKDPPSSEGPDSRWSMTSWTSSIRSKDDRDTPMERIDEHSPSKPAQPAHLSVSTSASEQTQQPWSPASFSSSKTARTTMDSDAYSTINRVLDHYHDPSFVSPEMMHDVQQRIFTQSPDLARQGGWDPKKVTQLYLQQMARGRYVQTNTQPNGISEPSKVLSKKRTSSLSVPQPVSEKEVRNDMDEKMVQGVERARAASASSANNLETEEGDARPARASLNRPDDWDMSPSLGELQLQAADSPADDKPSLPPKDWRSVKRQLAEAQDQKETQRAPLAPESRPQLPPIEGLGLAINIMPPQSGDSPTISAPPLPGHSPPPPPMPSVDLETPSQTAANALPGRPADGDVPISSVPTSDSSRQRSINRSSVPTEATSKNSSPSPDQKRLTKRRHIIKELVDTEHSFGQDMKVVDDIYKGTSNVIIISAEDVKTLFSNSDQIVAFSTNFLDALKQASKSVYVLAKSKRWRSNRVSNATSYSGNTDDQSSLNDPELSDNEKDRKTFIGEAFSHNMTNMEKIYSDYLKNHDAANQKLQILQKNPKVQIWLKECRAYAHDLTSAWDLDSLLVKPVQRILKYPLLLDQLLEVTPENHPDFTSLDVAVREMKGISMRINEMKKRADLMEQVTSTRKRKESDVRVGLSKAFGRRTEKLRQQVGLSDMVDDRTYTAVSEKFGSHFFQLQVVMRDVEMYTNDVQVFMGRFCDFALAMEAHIDVAQTSYPEVESKWRKFRMSTREMSTVALTDHITNVRKNVIEPMMTLLKLHDGPQKLMQKRDKRVIDYARFRAMKDRGDKPDKKTIEQGEQFMAVNDTLKEELPKLFALTGKLVEACLNNFIQLQVQWQILWKRKLSAALDDVKVSSKVEDIVDSFTGDFAFFEAQVMSLSACNGSMLNETVNFLSPSTTLQGDDPFASRKGTSLDSKRRTMSISSDKSPVLPQPDFGTRGSGSFLAIGDGVQLAPGPGLQREPSRRMRASSTLSGHSPRTPEIPGSYHSYSSSTTPVNSTPGRPTTAAGRTVTDPSPSLRPSMENPTITRLGDDSSFAVRPTSQNTYPPTSQPRASSPSARYSGFFSSAMPMSDSPSAESPPNGFGQQDFNVIFLAASVYEFNIDRARKEAGYPYLTYVAGEIFDVIGEKGELWLAKNQDDATNLVGWIWNKHFVKLAS